MSDFADVQYEFCDDLPWTEGCIEERRHLQAREDRRQIKVAVEHGARQQAGAAREAAGLSLQGDGVNAGQGWWCFEGRADRSEYGRCGRSLERCADRLTSAVDKGLTPGEPECIEQAQAACFEVTRSLREGTRPLCFPSVALCDRFRAVALDREQGAVGVCGTYS